MLASMGLVKSYAAIVGAVLVLLGLLGFIGNPIVGDPSPGHDPIFITGTIHNLIHLITGALLLYLALGLRGDQQILGVAAIGVLYLAVFVLTLINPSLFDMLNHPVNAADYVLHLGLAVASLGVAWYERSGQGPGRLSTRR